MCDKVNKVDATETNFFPILKYSCIDTGQIVQQIRRGVDDNAEFSRLFEHLMHLFNSIF